MNHYHRNSPLALYNRRQKIKGWLTSWAIFLALFTALGWIVLNISRWPVFAAEPMTNEEACKAVGYQMSKEVRSYCNSL